MFLRRIYDESNGLVFIMSWSWILVARATNTTTRSSPGDDQAFVEDTWWTTFGYLTNRLTEVTFPPSIPMVRGRQIRAISSPNNSLTHYPSLFIEPICWTGLMRRLISTHCSPTLTAVHVYVHSSLWRLDFLQRVGVGGQLKDS